LRQINHHDRDRFAANVFTIHAPSLAFSAGSTEGPGNNMVNRAWRSAKSWALPGVVSGQGKAAK